MEIYAHRGAITFAPENTLKAVKKAIELGVDGVEIDVRLTKDKELVVIHDKKVDRTTNGKGHVHSFTLEEIKELEIKGGEKIPTLEEVLKETKMKCKLNIELKISGAEEKAIELIEKYEMKNYVVISSYKHNVVKRIKEIDKGIEAALLVIGRKGKNYVPLVKKFKANGIHILLNKVTKEMVEKLHQEGYFIRVYSLSMKKKQDKKCADNLRSIGVDGLITFYPEILK